jgi:hypothetical protein
MIDLTPQFLAHLKGLAVDAAEASELFHNGLHNSPLDEMLCRRIQRFESAASPEVVLEMIRRLEESGGGR